MDVLKLIADENPTHQIAEKLFISVPTVETHRRHLMHKLGVKSVVGKVKFAIKHGLPLDLAQKNSFFCANYTCMATNIDLDAAKLSQIMAIKPFKSKKEAVNEALTNYLNYLLTQQALTLKGSKIWEGSLDQMRRD
ncbi:LuxR C-terminal-related transcriptional regulator [Larkinella sp. VNQ87]|uniref:LuxR C-terminal-related transcriptional regulator n=1 Tax=Larkinella sp. VNQ87 TaxID=3400921 RepID=UPI003C09E1A3